MQYKRRVKSSCHSSAILGPDGEEAETNYRNAISIRERLVVEFPKEPGYQAALIWSYDNLGSLLTLLQRMAEAREQLEKALALAENYLAAKPKDPDRRSNVAQMHSSLGSLFWYDHKQQEAEKHYRAAADLAEKLAADYPSHLGYQHDMVIFSSNLAMALSDNGPKAWKEAEELFIKATTAGEKLIARSRAERKLLVGVAGMQNNFGNLLTRMNRSPEAAEQYRKVLAVRARFAADFPSVPQYRFDLAASHLNLGLALTRSQQDSEALEHFQKAETIFAKLVTDFPEVPIYREKLGVGRYHVGGTLQKLGRTETDSGPRPSSSRTGRKARRRYP